MGYYVDFFLKVLHTLYIYMHTCVYMHIYIHTHMCTHTYVHACCHFSCVWLCVTPWTVARQAPLTLGFSRQEYWSGLPCPPPGDLPNPGFEPRSPELQADSLSSEPSRKPKYECTLFKFLPSTIKVICLCKVKIIMQNCIKFLKI